MARQHGPLTSSRLPESSRKGSGVLHHHPGKYREGHAGPIYRVHAAWAPAVQVLHGMGLPATTVTFREGQGAEKLMGIAMAHFPGRPTKTRDVYSRKAS